MNKLLLLIFPLNKVYLFIALTATLFITHNPLTHAQSKPQTTNERRYQIEMIIFKRTGSSAYTDGERWRRDITLNYPQSYQQLIPTSTTENTPAVTAHTSPNFYTMPKSARVLGNLIYSLQNRGQYRVLFHEAWQQQINTENNPAIIIQGGDSIGQHRELEGSIQLWVSRYLHIETNLWFTRFSATSYPDTATNSSISNAESNVEDEENNEWPTLPLLPVNDRQSVAKTDGLHSNNPSYNTPTVEYITTLREKRRMRSEELHYIDHPIVGLLIIIKPVE